MKTYKLILLICIAVIFNSCGTNRVSTTSVKPITPLSATITPIFNIGTYDYQYFDNFYSMNPNFFHYNVWYDAYGHMHYYHDHPYYIRYCIERGITPYRGRSNQNYYYNGRIIERNKIRQLNSNTKPTRVNNNVRRKNTNTKPTRVNNNIRRKNTNTKPTRVNIKQRKVPKRGG